MPEAASRDAPERGNALTNHRRQFIEFALKGQALSFGDFTTKAGRRSPYFFNTGRFDSGASVGALSAMLLASQDG